MGFQIPSPDPGFGQAGPFAFAEGTGRSIETWETYIKDRRKKMGLPGDPDRPFQWSLQDFYVIAALKLSNIIFAHTGPAATTVIERWIRPPSSGTVKVTNPMFIIFWGSQQLLVTKGKIYAFTSKDLPSEFMAALEAATPMPEAVVKGYLAASPEPTAASEFNFSAADVIQLPEPATAAAAAPPLPSSSEFNFSEPATAAAAAAAAAAAPKPQAEFNFSEPATATAAAAGAGGVTESKGND